MRTVHLNQQSNERLCGHLEEIFVAMQKLCFSEKSLTFTAILRQINEDRKTRKADVLKRHPNWNENLNARRMSPTTLNKKLKFLVEYEMIEKVKRSYKNVVYKFVELQSQTWYLSGAIGTIAESLNILGFCDFRQVFGISDVLPKLSDDQLRRLQQKMLEASKLIGYYRQVRKA